MAHFPETDISPDTLQHTEHTTQHPELGLTSWYTVQAGKQIAPRGAWRHIDLPTYASELQGRVAFSWPAMEAFADCVLDLRRHWQSTITKHRAYVSKPRVRGRMEAAYDWPKVSLLSLTINEALASPASFHHSSAPRALRGIA